MKYCFVFQDAIEDLADDLLPQQQRASLEAHLADCPGCRAYYQSLTAMSAGLRDESDVAPTAFLHESIMQAVSGASFRKRRKRRAWLAAIAACSLLVLGVSAAGGLLARHNNTSLCTAADSKAAKESALQSAVSPQSAGAVSSKGAVSPQSAADAEAVEWLENNGYVPDASGGVYTITPDAYDDLLSYLGETEETSDILILSDDSQAVQIFLPDQ